MTKDEALKLALEALEELNNTNSYWWQEVDKQTIEKIEPAITAIKEALAQPEPWEKFCDSNCVWTDHHPDCKLAEQEPVAFINVEQRKLEWAKYMTWDTPTVVNLPKIPLYTTQPQRPWVGLTDEEITTLDMETSGTTHDFVDAVEAALRSKNT
ncbi:hypothetical protein UFOVP173_2 [uncultured Caudovirales phage]|uniref:Uncharacterized protein n=1 Tax=uncultured Caudovirales phage TaxID=2100421 RepID=A0A6J7WEP8_9CAUD|nr:hypothetical protein UFOVP173_2 [uncultured Caudovirales phage]